ncbi:NAD-dependent epimerase/dehydratase family protein [Paraflavitalea soli]|uniref:NAD-dependent epimerase/dehydratase family protein n=1 Tax=Paraflavitalea soli TaxID=2315862 RepID=A0A3B7MKB8_9BACT|nr:NAD(P)H-binding protein [Paraflavitalea soli]AXY73476.1 NAD-dependent epimerase/dehydratase family protein [Paraflavitalea soli]
MKALIIGATGATGKDLVNVLLQDPAYTAVVIFVRRPVGISHPKLTEVLTDFDKLEGVSQFIKGDVWISCLGTTLKAAGTKDKQWHIDYEIPLKFAEIARANGISRTVLLSAYGASAKSKVFYSQMKGKLEDTIAGLSFDQYIIFRPGLLLRKDSDRSGERIMASLLKFLNGIGIIRKFKPMPTSTLAEKLAKAPKVLPAGKHIIELDKIFGF